MIVKVHTTISIVGENVVVAVDGPVDLASVGHLHDELGRAIRRHPAQVLVVDLDGISVLDDAGLGVLLGAAASARESGGDLEIVCTRASLRDRLDRTRFDRAVAVRATIA